MLSSEHRGVRPVVYSSTAEYCALLLHHRMAGSGGVVFSSGKHSAHGQLRGGWTGIKGDADLDPCERRGTRWHPPSSIAFLSALFLHEPKDEGEYGISP